MGLKIIKGNKVRIAKPDFFVRCGYDLTFNEQVKDIREKFSRDIWELIQKTLPAQAVYTETIHRRIVNALAYSQLHTKMKRGSGDRKIYTETLEDQKDKVYTVAEVKFCKTGQWQPGSYSSYDNDYDPPILCNETTHRLLRLYGLFPIHFCEDLNQNKELNWIEAENVVLDNSPEV